MLMLCFVMCRKAFCIFCFASLCVVMLCFLRQDDKRALQQLFQACEPTIDYSGANQNMASGGEDFAISKVRCKWEIAGGWMDA
jgi:hypothetical protein